MKGVLISTALLVCVFYLNVADAYTISCNPSGTTCVVTCSNGQPAGTMYWNGSQWSDGIRSSPNRDVLARQIVAAQGSACR